ncbi:ANK1 [Symbiodinium sp. CCMP2592]|nr:ANK1 [Symbiodinium sp. CCMP2592]
MVSVWRASGARLVTIPLEELSDVLTLKRYLQGICGLPRFQQRLLHDGMDLKDSFKFHSPMDVQLVLLPLSDASESERRELLDAVGSVQVLEIEKILQRPQDPNLADFSGNTPLARAAMQGNLDIMRLLLEASASTNALSGPPDWTPLHSASLNGHVEGVSLLLQFRADMNLRIRNGATALHVASVLGQPEIASLLLEAGAPKNSQLDNGMTPLHVASAHGHSEVVRVLLKARVDLTSNQRKGRTALHSAAKKGHVLVVQMLLEAGFEKEVPQKDGSTALHIASKHGQAEVVRLLLGLRAHPNLRQLAGKTALHFASRRGHVDVARSLLEAGSEKEGVLAASAAGHVEVVRLLYEFKADERLRPTGVVALQLAYLVKAAKKYCSCCWPSILPSRRRRGRIRRA